MKNTARGILLMALLISQPRGNAQTKNQATDEGKNVPVDTRWTLDAAGEVQRNAIRSVLLLVCSKTQMKGTGFIIAGGRVVTAAHVVAGCEAEDVTGITPMSEAVKFSGSIIADVDVDLAVLTPTTSLTRSLELGPDVDIPLGMTVTTWGYPLIYNGPAPLLSVGYVSGYYGARIGSQSFKHIVVNGAFNPGNSGGPVFQGNSNKVVGVVIWKKIAFSDQVKVAIDGFRSPIGITMGGRFSKKLPNGQTVSVTDEEVIASVLEEFYNKVQVDIGEAVSVSELRKFLTQHHVPF